MKIGFIGVGNMGGPMVRNLLKAGDAVTVFDVSSEAVAALAGDGAVAADSPAAAVSGAELVITMLPAGAHVREVYCGDGGVIAAATSGTVLIDCSTIDVESARERLAAIKTRRPAERQYEFQALRKDGTTLWLQNSVQQVTWDGQPASLAIVTDVSERKQAETALSRR